MINCRVACQHTVFKEKIMTNQQQSKKQRHLPTKGGLPETFALIIEITKVKEVIYTCKSDDLHGVQSSRTQQLFELL